MVYNLKLKRKNDLDKLHLFFNNGDDVDLFSRKIKNIKVRYPYADLIKGIESLLENNADKCAAYLWSKVKNKIQIRRSDNYIGDLAVKASFSGCEHAWSVFMQDVADDKWEDTMVRSISWGLSHEQWRMVEYILQNTRTKNQKNKKPADNINFDVLEHPILSIENADESIKMKAFEWLTKQEGEGFYEYIVSDVDRLISTSHLKNMKPRSKEFLKAVFENEKVIKIMGPKAVEKSIINIVYFNKVNLHLNLQYGKKNLDVFDVFLDCMDKMGAIKKIDKNKNDSDKSYHDFYATAPKEMVDAAWAGVADSYIKIINKYIKLPEKVLMEFMDLLGESEISKEKIYYAINHQLSQVNIEEGERLVLKHKDKLMNDLEFINELNGENKGYDTLSSLLLKLKIKSNIDNNSLKFRSVKRKI